jgi:hypothetical protein
MKLVALAALAALALAAPAERTPSQAPRLLGLRVGNGSRPFAGDRRLLTTVSPNGDGFRDAAIVHFRLTAAATVEVVAVETDQIRRGTPSTKVIWSKRVRLSAGPHRLVWRPDRGTPERTYILRLTVTGRSGRRRVYGAYRPGPHMRVDAPVVRVQGIEAAFRRHSYAPGEQADVSVSSDARSLRFQVFAYSNLPHPTERDLKTRGEAMTPPVVLDWRTHRSAPHRVRLVRAGEWPSGLYFLRITAGDGRVGYAPFILRPRRLGTHRVAVVLSTNTWQAYNFDDADGDGWGDSWYVSAEISRIDLTRPYLDFGVPFRFKDWDLTFISWLNATGRHVDFLSDDDLERIQSGDALARTYDLIVFPGHEEYVTSRVYDALERYRDLGGNLMFLAANNFFWKVRRSGSILTRVGLWRNLGRPESSLVGVQYVASDYGQRQGAYVVTGADEEPWLFDGTGLRNGDRFGTYGIEIDKRTRYSPRATRLLAEIPNLMGPGRSAQMTFYEERGAKVFAAGAINFAASADQPVVSRLLSNLWDRLSRP